MRSRYGAATGRGTHWNALDGGDGTAEVVDLDGHITGTASAGHRYMAIAPGKKNE